MWKAILFAWALLSCPSVAWSAESPGPAPATETEDQELYLWREWWGYNQKLFSAEQEPLPQAARERVAGLLQEVIEGPWTEDDPLLADALLAVANFRATLPERERRRAREIFLLSLGHPDAEVRERAALALGALGSPSALPDLRDVALDTLKGRARGGSTENPIPEATRAFAIYGLGLLGAAAEDELLRRDIVEVLWRVLNAPRGIGPDVTTAAVLAMGVVPLRVIDDWDPMEAEHGGYLALGAPTTRAAQVCYLAQYFPSDSETPAWSYARSHAPRSIVRLIADRPEMKPFVVGALLPYVTKRGNIGVRECRQSAAMALGEIGDLDNDPEDLAIRKALKEATRNADLMVKSFSLLALGRIGGRAGSGLAPLSAESDLRAYLILHLTRGKTQLRPWAGLALGVMEHGLRQGQESRTPANLFELQAALRLSNSTMDSGAYAIGLGLARAPDCEFLLRQKLEGIDDELSRKFLRQGLLLLSTQTQAGSNEMRSWEDHLRVIQDRSQPLGARRSALVILNRRAGNGVAPWNALFSPNLNYRSNTASLTGAKNPGLLDLEWRQGPPPVFWNVPFNYPSCMGGSRDAVLPAKTIK